VAGVEAPAAVRFRSRRARSGAGGVGESAGGGAAISSSSTSSPSPRYSTCFSSPPVRFFQASRTPSHCGSFAMPTMLASTTLRSFCVRVTSIGVPSRELGAPRGRCACARRPRGRSVGAATSARRPSRRRARRRSWPGRGRRAVAARACALREAVFLEAQGVVTRTLVVQRQRHRAGQRARERPHAEPSQRLREARDVAGPRGLAQRLAREVRDAAERRRQLGLGRQVGQAVAEQRQDQHAGGEAGIELAAQRPVAGWRAVAGGPRA
jgi:hypothetical protein